MQIARWQSILIIAVCVYGFLALLPNLLPRQVVDAMPAFLPRHQLVLGLDLQGGAYLMYQVDRADYTGKRLVTLTDDVRTALLKEPRIRYTGLGVTDGAVQVRIRDAAQVEEARTRLNGLLNPLASSLFGGGPVNEFALAEPEPGLMRLGFADKGLQQRVRGIVDQSIEVVRRRVDELGTTEPSIQREGDDRLLVEAPGGDPQQLKNVIGTTAQLTFHLVDVTADPQEALRTRPPAGKMVLSTSPDDEDEPSRPYVMDEVALLTGEELTDAQPTFVDGRPAVSFKLSTGGSQRFCAVTTQNIGKPFAIVLDQTVVSAPRIQSAICQGSGQITGNFSVQQANDLAVLLRAGALPAKLTLVEERTVGPGLGADSINAGALAAVVAAILVTVLMVLVYGLFGVFADIALAVNVVLILGILSTLGATLTLPGIAGIVLTMGVAVDANVLIYERIRDELRVGRPPITAISAGFSRAMSPIVDANITTLIAAVVLFQLGSGPVRGFAVTLAIGVLTTMFTAVTVTRLIVATWVRMTRPKIVPV